MEKRVEVTYNPQLGYLKTVFTHNFDFLTAIREYQVQGADLIFKVDTYQKGSARVVVTRLTDTSFRFRMYPDENTSVFENSVFQPHGEGEWKVQEQEDCLLAETGRLTLRFGKQPWEMSVLLDGKPLLHENVCDSNVDNMCKYLPVGFDRDENGKVVRVREAMYLYADEKFYGFGEKFTGFEKRGQKIHVRQSDALSTNTEASYKNIPCFLSTRGYLMLLNTYTDNTFDMGCTSGVSWGVEAEDAMLDYILFCNRDYKGLLEDYTALSGRSPMIPKWAFGLWMSKCSYMTQEEVETVARTCREKHIPLDVIHIDGWQDRDNSGVWQWDRERFPDPQGMIRTLREMNVHLSLWMWPYIRVGSQGYEYALEKGYLVMNEKGEVSTFHSAATNDYYFAAFDFTNPHMVEWYRGLVQNVVKDGVGVIKTDFSEALPMDSVYYDGSNGLQGHNKLPLLYANTIYEACRDCKTPNGEPPMLWGRSGYAGSQNYPGNWAGDSSTHENNLACVLRGGLSIGVSGVPFWGHDIGGFYNTDSEGFECPPTEQQYIRSAQFGLLSPLSRCHGKTPREPWNFSERAQEIFIRYDSLRYRLTPYLYSTAWESHHTGIPMMRPLFLEFPQDYSARTVELEYMLGGSLLVAPVFDQDDFAVYLPKGEWVDLGSGDFVEGAAWIQPETTLEDIPVYLRQDSAVILRSEDVEYIEEKPFDDLHVVLNLKNEVCCNWQDDDRQYDFFAKMDGTLLTIETTLPLKEVTIYSQKEVNCVTINGKTVDVDAKNQKEYKIIL